MLGCCLLEVSGDIQHFSAHAPVVSLILESFGNRSAVVESLQQQELTGQLRPLQPHLTVLPDFWLSISIFGIAPLPAVKSDALHVWCLTVYLVIFSSDFRVKAIEGSSFGGGCVDFY